MLDRRASLCGSISATLAMPLAAEAQRAKTPVIGVLSPWGPSLRREAHREPFERGLRELGWIPGSTIVIEQRYADGKPDRLPTLAAELVQMKVDLIVANGAHAIRAARQATTTIPIVMAAGGDPLREGHVQNLARPGGNVTGLSLFPQGRMEPKQLELLREAVPGLTDVGVLANRLMGDPADEEIRAAARTLVRYGGLMSYNADLYDIHRRSASYWTGFSKASRPPIFLSSNPPSSSWSSTSRPPGPSASRSRRRCCCGRIRSLSEPAGLPVRLHRHSPCPPLVAEFRAQIAQLALKHNMPTMLAFREYVEAGGLMSYGASLSGAHRRAATQVDKILKGVKPGDLPVEQMTTFEFVINLKTAKTLGLTIPPSLLLRANRVIE